MNKNNGFNQNNDYKFPAPLGDSISTLSLNGNATTPSTILIAGAWDNTLTCYELQRGTQPNTLTNVVVQGQIKHDAPILCSDIAADGVTTFSAGCDGQIRMWNVTQGPQAVQIIGKHDQPVRSMKFIQEKQILVTASWDKSVRVWDCRQPNPVQSITFPERIYAMDAKNEALVIGTADKLINIYNLASMNAAVAQYKSPLQYQLRCISIFSDNEGFAVGCIEGRVAIEYFNEMSVKQQISNGGAKPANMKSFVFKCHRHESDIYAVNAIDFYKNNSLLTAGSDGTFCFWNKDIKQRLGNYESYKFKSPITCAKFAPYGDMMFYSLSYDWSKGVSSNNNSYPNTIMMHPILDQEMVQRQR
mmetsp:Transcript_22637/g.20562  ORF Transcript_22637/g.20562 Transcript_22637/m.20562 type:complete len:359 (+) Transcript_22637:14-1090(+)